MECKGKLPSNAPTERDWHALHTGNWHTDVVSQQTHGAWEQWRTQKVAASAIELSAKALRFPQVFCFIAYLPRILNTQACSSPQTVAKAHEAFCRPAKACTPVAEHLLAFTNWQTGAVGKEWLVTMLVLLDTVSVTLLVCLCTEVTIRYVIIYILLKIAIDQSACVTCDRYVRSHCVWQFCTLCTSPSRTRLSNFGSVASILHFHKIIITVQVQVRGFCSLLKCKSSSSCHTLSQASKPHLPTACVRCPIRPHFTVCDGLKWPLAVLCCQFSAPRVFMCKIWDDYQGKSIYALVVSL